jgi:hypothetical protein
MERYTPKKLKSSKGVPKPISPNESFKIRSGSPATESYTTGGRRDSQSGTPERKRKIPDISKIPIADLSSSSSLSPYESPTPLEEGGQEATEQGAQEGAKEGKQEVFVEKELQITRKELEEQVEELEKMRKIKMKIIVITDTEIKKVINNVETLTGKTIINKDKYIMLFYKIFEKNKLLFDDKLYYFYYDGDIYNLKIQITKNELIKIFGNMNDVFMNYFINFITSAFTSSSHYFFTYSVTKGKIDFYIDETTLDLEKYSFGIIFFYDYFEKMFNHTSCVVNIFPVKELIPKVNEMNNIIKQYYDTNTLPPDDYVIYLTFLYELKLKYGYECNLYYYHLIYYILVKYLDEEKLEYDFRIEETKLYEERKLRVNKMFIHAYDKCLDTKKNYIIIPLTTSGESWSHQNILLLDRKNNLVERFEPHGYFFNEDTTHLDMELAQIFKDYKFTSDTCMTGVQQLESLLPKRFRGKCVSLSFGYLLFKLNRISKGIKESPRATSIAYLNEAIDRKIRFFKDVIGLIDTIFKETSYQLDNINRSLHTSFEFNGNILTFKDIGCKKK